MSYSKAIYRIDLVSGSDTARSALASCNMTNSSGVVTVAKVGHGLVNGAVVDVPTGAYSGGWIVKKTDNDNFTLHTAHAIGTMTITGTPIADETFVVGSQTFTFKAARGGTGEVTIGANINSTAKNIVDAINTDIGGITSNYIALLDYLYFPDSKNIKKRIYIYYLPPGTGGNSIVFTESATGISVDGSGTLSGGADSTYSSNRSGVSITPRGGMSWTDAWLTWKSGATSSRCTANDVVIVSKTSNPTSIGDATWTENSKTVTLATSGLTASICQCEADWTSVNATSSAKLAVATDAKEGSYCVKIVEDGTPANGEVQAYFATGTLTLTSYQKISFWLKNEVAITAGMLVIELCSDVSGTTAIDTFQIPAIPSVKTWVPLVIARDGGGNLGHNDGTDVKSIRVANGASGYYTASKYIYIDNIIACTTSGINHQSLITKDSSAFGSDEGFYSIQSIVDTSIILDGINSTKSTDTKYVYCGNTDTVETYIRSSFNTPLATLSGTIVNTFVNGVIYLGGFEVGTHNQNGITVLNGQSGFGSCFNNGSGIPITVTNFSFIRYYTAIFCDINILYATNIIVANCTISIQAIRSLAYNYIPFVGMCGYGLYYSTVNHGLTFIGNNYSCGCGMFYIAFRSYFEIGNILNSHALDCGTYGYSIYYGGYNNDGNVGLIYSAYTTAIRTQDGSYTENTLRLYNTTITSTTEYTTSDTNTAAIYSYNHDNSAGNNRVFMFNCEYFWQTVTYHGSDPGSWEMYCKRALDDFYKPGVNVMIKIAEIAVLKDKEVTVTAWVKKDHATLSGGVILITLENEKTGVIETYDTKSDDTDWEELSINFTPTISGVQSVYIIPYGALSNNKSYLGSISVTQE